MIQRTRIDRRSRLRTGALVLVAAAVGALAIWQRGALLLAASRVADAGWVLAPAFVVFLIWNHVAAIGWRDLVVATSVDDPPSVWWLSLVRLESQALNLIVPAAGELARAARRGTSVVLDVITTTIAEAAFAAGALLLHPALRPAAGARLALLGLFAVVVALAWAWLPALLSRLFPSLRARRHELTSAFRRAVGWHLVECLLGAVEIWMFAASLHISLSGRSILLAAAAVRAASTLGGFVPGQVGVAEGGLVWALTAVGQPPWAG